MEMTVPYIKNADIFICPSGSKERSTFTTGCTAATSKVTSHYVWPGWFPYDYYQWFAPGNAIMFSGFPTPRTTNCSPTRPWSACVSAEFTANPAESAFMVEGYFVSYFPSGGLTFGSACTTGFSGDWNNNKIHRHSGGWNIAYCDGHAKWVKGQNFHTNTSAVHAYGGSNYPESPFMRVGS